MSYIDTNTIKDLVRPLKIDSLLVIFSIKALFRKGTIKGTITLFAPLWQNMEKQSTLFDSSCFIHNHKYR